MLTATSLVESYLEHKRETGRSVATIQAFRNALAQFYKAVQVEDLREITYDELVDYAKSVTARLKPESAHLYVRTVKEFFRFLAETHQLLVDPAQAVPLPKLNRKLIGPTVTQEEVERLFASCNVETPMGLRDRAMLEFAYSTALRVAELHRVKVSDVDVTQEIALVCEGKGGKDRVVPIGRAALEWLNRYLSIARPVLAKSRPEVEELFITYRSRGFSYSLLRAHLRKLGRVAKLSTNLTCHVFRRTVATEMLRNGASPAQVAALLGHEDLKSLSRYVASVAKELKKAHASSHPRESENE